MPEEKLQKHIWDLYLEYERLLKFSDPLDPMVVLTSKEEEHFEQIPTAVIESENKAFIFAAKIDFKKRRQVPSNLQVNLNLGLNFPPNIRPEQIPGHDQQILQQLVQQAAQDVQRLVQEEIKRQSPEIGIDLRVYGGKWEEQKEEVKS